MELKRLLTRATALLLQGAYQGAESFIEQAMAEADKLKQKLPEIDTLRTRFTEMAAEVESLQSVIDEANAQEPLTTIQVLQGYPHVVSHSQCGVKDGIYKVYAERPIPAQQSYEQALNLLAESRENFENQFGFSSDADWVYKDLAELFISDLPAQQSPAILNGVYENKCSCGSFFFGVKNQPFCAKCYDDKLRVQQSPAAAVPDPSELDVYRWFQESTIAHHIEEGGGHISKRAMFLAKKAIAFAQQSPRITEQDALEIAKEFLPYWEACEMAVTVDECFDYWVATHAFSHLLNKLNANAVAEAKVNAASNHELADAIMEFSGNFIGAYLNGFIDTPFTNIAQIYQVARNHVKDSYGIETKTLIELIGKEDFDRCYAPVPAQAAAMPGIKND